MTKKICGNCVEFSFNKYSTSNFDDRHYCNLAIRNGDFEDSICLRLPTESCENYKGVDRMTEKQFTNDRWQIYDNGKILSVSETEKLLNKLHDENEQLKQQNKKLEAQLYCPSDSICIKCNNEYLMKKGKYYVSKCKKGHEQCSKTDVVYCDDFDMEEVLND